MLTRLFALLFVALLGLAQAETLAKGKKHGKGLEKGHRGGNSRCARELQGIIYSPDTCASQYLRKITQSLRCSSDLLFGPLNTSVIFQFQNAYGVEVSLIDAFGISTSYAGNVLTVSNPFIDTSDPVYFGPGRMSAFLNLGGFTYSPPTGSYYLFNVYNDVGEMFTVKVFLPASIQPVC